MGQNNRAWRILSMYLLISGGLSSQYGAPSRGSGGAGGFGGSSGGYGGASGGNYTHEVTSILTRRFIRDSGKSIWFLHAVNMALFFVSIYYQIVLYYHKIWQNIIQATGQTQVTLHANQTHVLPNDPGVYTSTIFQVKSLFVCLFVCLWCVVVIILNEYPKFIDMSGQIIVWDHSEPGGTEKASFF